MKRGDVTEEEMGIIRKASRAGKSAQETATELDRAVATVRNVAHRLGCPFKKSENVFKGPRGSYSEERKAAVRAGVIAAKVRREGLGL